MKLNFWKKGLVFGILFIIFGSGFVSGYYENEETFEGQCIVNNIYYSEDFPVITPFPAYLLKNNFYNDYIELIDTPDEFSWKNFEGKNILRINADKDELQRKFNKSENEIPIIMVFQVKSMSSGFAELGRSLFVGVTQILHGRLYT